MILIAGGTGRLGTQVVRLLTAQGLQVRVLTRDRARARNTAGGLVDAVVGDVRDRHAVEQVTAGVRTVISAVHGLVGTGDANPRTVDGQGNSNLIAASRAADVEHFILVSVQGAAPDHPMELARMKYRAEEELKSSGLAWTIVRASPFMETWSQVIGEPLLKDGKTRIFGHGTNPINFVSVHDVAHVIARAVTAPALRGVLVNVGGPENLSLRQFVETFQAVTGTAGTVSAVPLPLIRVMSLVMQPINPMLARQIQAGVVMDTYDMTFDPTDLERRYPWFPMTSLADVVRRDYVSLSDPAASVTGRRL